MSKKPVAGKPQEPVLPYPYHSEDVSFRNPKAGITLGGTLTMPRNGTKLPAVILISGGGPQDRNSQFLGHKPFLVIADYLTRQGFAVLRYDDRGVGKSSGDFASATSLDFATDAESALVYLRSRKEIDPQKIGFAGHSEGGLIGAIVASGSKDVHFLVSLAGPGVVGIDGMILQTELISRAGGVDEDGMARIRKLNQETAEIIMQSADTIVLREKLTAYTKANLENYPDKMFPPGMPKEQLLKDQIDRMCTPWYQFIYKTDPAVYFRKVTSPVLALNGSKDLQVDARQNLPAITKAVKEGGNPNVTALVLPDLNHFFQKSKNGHPSEYADNQDTFSPIALTAMSDWLHAQTK